MPDRPERLAMDQPNAGGPRVSKKTTLLILGGVIGIGGIIYLMRKKKKAEEPAVATEAGALTSQAFIPVTGENVAGVGAGGGGLSYGGEQNANSALLEYIKLNNEHSEEHERLEKEWIKELFAKLGTGGGVPGPQGATGPVGPEGPHGGGSPGPHPEPGKTPAGGAKCPSSFPLYNPAKGAPGPKSCYKYSRDRCPDKTRPFKHVYEGGEVVCSPS